MSLTKDKIDYINSRVLESANSLIGSNDCTVDYHLNVIKTFMFMLEESNNIKTKNQLLIEINSLLKSASKLASGGIGLAYLHYEYTSKLD